MHLAMSIWGDCSSAAPMDEPPLISTLGVFDEALKDFLDILAELGCDKTRRGYVLRTIIYLTITTNCFVFCCKSKELTNPNLMKY